MSDRETLEQAVSRISGRTMCSLPGAVSVRECLEAALREMAAFTMAENEWTKCSDRVPENNDCILIWNGINVIFGRYEHFHGGSCFTYAGGGQIVHPEYWMPLPKGPAIRKGGVMANQEMETKQEQPTRTPLTDLLDIWLGHDDRGVFMVSNKCRQLVEDFKALRAELEQVRRKVGEWETAADTLRRNCEEQVARAEASESREKRVREALEKIAELKPTADNPFYALRTIHEIKEIARRALEGE